VSVRACVRSHLRVWRFESKELLDKGCVLRNVVRCLLSLEAQTAWSHFRVFCVLQWAVRIVTTVFERASHVFVRRRIPEDPDVE
jgi:hypothetical protein